MFIACGFLRDAYKRWPSDKTKHINSTHVNNCLVFTLSLRLSLSASFVAVVNWWYPSVLWNVFQISSKPQPMDFQSHRQASKRCDILLWFFYHSILLFEWQVWHSSSSKRNASQPLCPRLEHERADKKQSPLSLHIAHSMYNVHAYSRKFIHTSVLILHTVLPLKQAMT